MRAATAGVHGWALAGDSGLNTQEFCYWLNGFCELTTEAPTEAQWQSIKEHLALTFQKVTPPLGGLIAYRKPSLDEIAQRTPSMGQMQGLDLGAMQVRC